MSVWLCNHRRSDVRPDHATGRVRNECWEEVPPVRAYIHRSWGKWGEVLAEGNGLLTNAWTERPVVDPYNDVENTSSKRADTWRTMR